MNGEQERPNGMESDAVILAAPLEKRKKEVLPANIYAFLFAIAKSFGFPALMVLALGGYLYKIEHEHREDIKQQLQAEREDRKEAQGAFLDALSKNTSALDRVATAQEKTNDTLDVISDELKTHVREHR